MLAEDIQGLIYSKMNAIVELEQQEQLDHQARDSLDCFSQQVI